jgi:hypothetical protein
MISPRQGRCAAAAAFAAVAGMGTVWLRAGPAAAQTSAGPAAFVAQMQAIERQRVEALVKGEAAVTERLTADDYHLISPTARSTTRPRRSGRPARASTFR